MEQCCGTCKYHVRPDIPLWMHLPCEGDWVCNNGESEYYGLENGYEDECVDYEEREQWSS